MKILALDIATSVGWCVDSDRVCPPWSGVWRNPAAGMGIGPASLKFSEQCCNMFRVHKPDLVVIEAPAHGGKGIIMKAETSFLLVSLAGHALSCATAFKIPTMPPVHVATVRKHFLGNGRPDNPKRATIERCRLLGWDVANHDAADAAALWAYAKAMKDKSFRLEAATPLFGKAGAR